MRKDTKNIIEIPKQVRIPGTDYILEEGDKIEILNERIDYFLAQTITSHLQNIDLSDKQFVANTLYLSIVGSLSDLYEDLSDIEEVKKIIFSNFRHSL